MKKFLKFSGICAALIGLVAFILMLATPGILKLGDNAAHVYPGTTVIFGGKAVLSSGGASLSAFTYNGSALEIIAFILALLALVVVIVGIILPALKINALQKFAGILNIFAVVCFVLAGVFMFIAIPTFSAANDNMNLDGYGLGAGWVIGGILYIAAGVVAILPAAVNLMGKK